VPVLKGITEAPLVQVIAVAPAVHATAAGTPVPGEVIDEIAVKE
jgi:hypothetical protein